MRSVAVLVFIAVLMIAIPATAENVLDRDSIKVFSTSGNEAGGGDETVTDTASTYGKANVDHAAGATITTKNLMDRLSDIYESIIVTYKSVIYTNTETGTYLTGADTINDSSNCSDLTSAAWCLDCCSTLVCSTAYTSFVDDSTSFQDSNTGYLYVEQTNTDALSYSAGDSCTPTWSNVATITWTSGITAREVATVKPTAPFLRVRAVPATLTDHLDTIYTTVWFDRNNSWEGDYPDYMGVMSVQWNAATAASYTDTIYTWPYDGDNHVAGQRMKNVFGDDEYTTLAVTVTPLATAGHASDSNGVYIVLRQSANGIDWAAVDSMITIGGADPLTQMTTCYDTLLFSRGKPYWAINTQTTLDSTDASTRMSYDVTTKMLK